MGYNPKEAMKMHGSVVMRLSGVAIALVAIVLLLAGGQPAYAVDITVNTTADDFTDDGDCSLREAITAANTDTARDACPAGSGADVITLPAGTYGLTIAGTSEGGNVDGDLDIVNALTINGAGAATTIIDAAGSGERHFDIFSNNGAFAVTMSGITMRSANGDQDGGAINNSQELTLNSVVITGNDAQDAGGIQNNGGAELTINDSTLSNNSASEKDNGGGIRNSGGTLTINRSTLNNNFGGQDGGGLANSGTATINNTTITGNTVNDGGIGGGISVFGATTINNSTIAGNSASGGGGGLSDETLKVAAQTFVSAGVPPVDDGASVALGNGEPSVDITNSIVANNTTGGDCDVTTLTSGGNNLDSDSTCDLTGTGDKPGQNPQLAALAANGGPTQTMAIPAGSPATDAGNNATCLATDQRGITRPQDGNSDGTAVCDMGAYELEPPAATPAPGTPTLAPATATPAQLPPTGDGSGGDGSLSPIWFVLGAMAAVVAATVGLRVARARG